MILYKCDRCGKIQKKPFKNTIEITTEKTYGEYFTQVRMFCNECTEDLVNWFIAYQKDGE